MINKSKDLSKAPSIKGIVIKQLKKIPDERGCIYHMLRCDDPIFEKFGEIYFSIVYPGVIKGWQLNREKTSNYAVIQGMIKLVLYDDRENSLTRGNLMELFIGEENYCLVKIPPNIWSGFMGIGGTLAIVANCATLPYDPNKIKRMDSFTNKIPYDWKLEHE
ncbi:hypothetical protein ES705_34421 [subsurface metagenome]